jgi:hypothetical protein
MENKKSNTNVKTTMDFFKQKRAKANTKKLFSHIEINGDNNTQEKTSFSTTTGFNSTNQSIYKTDLFQLDTYLNKMKQILIFFSEERQNQLLYNKDFNKKINSIKKNLEIDTKDSMASNRVKSLNINNLFKEYNVPDDKDMLISEIALENYTLKLLFEKLDDLFFLLNIKNFDSKKNFSKKYINNLSQILNIKYTLDILINEENNINIYSSNNSLQDMSINFDDKDGLDKGLLPMSKMNSNKSNIIIKEEEESNEKEGKTIYESKQAKSKYYSTLRSVDSGSMSSNVKEISIEIIKDVSNKINEMRKFSDFLNFEYEDEEFFKDIFSKIRELFYIYIMHIFDPLVELIKNKNKEQSDLVNKVQIVLKNEVNDVLENSILIRKVLEDNYQQLQNKIDELIKEKEVLVKQNKELEENFNKQKKISDEIGNRDYSIYYKQMKESNDFFLKEFEKIEKQRNEKIREEYEKQLKKNKDLKLEIKQCKEDNFALKLKLDNFNSIQDKKGDNFENALKLQFEDAVDGYKERVEIMESEYKKKFDDLRLKCNTFENENRKLKNIQGAIMKKLDTMESLFLK